MEKRREKIEGEDKENLEKEVKEKLEKAQNRQIKTILFVIGAIFLVFLVAYFVIDSIRNFNYQGAEFMVVREGDLIFYRTTIPFYSGITGQLVQEYNVYIRNDPRALRDIEFNGELNQLPQMVINATGEFDCEGYQNIAVLNLVNLFEKTGTEVLKDPEAECDEQGRYMFIHLIENENESKIEQFGPSCYNLLIKDCEVLEVTEKLMVELLSKINE